MVVLAALSGCAGDDPSLVVVLGDTWDEAPTTALGVEMWRSFRFEPDRLHVTQHCGDAEAVAEVVGYHYFTVSIQRAVSAETEHLGETCSVDYSAQNFQLFLDPDGRNLVTSAGRVMVPYTEVSSVFGGRGFMEDGSDIEWFFTPTFIDAVAKCSNDLRVSTVLPIELELFFEVSDAATNTAGDCQVDIPSGLYRYSPDGDAMWVTRNGGDRVDLIRRAE